jgi:hypothetical protein
MLFMNLHEIAMAVARTDQCSARDKASRLLYAHVDAISYHSDGWARWRAPRLAAYLDPGTRRNGSNGQRPEVCRDSDHGEFVSLESGNQARRDLTVFRHGAGKGASR